EIYEAIREDARTMLDLYRTETGYEVPGLSFVCSGRH
ncbi:MAG: hypothetical protein QOH60_793, partial [Mycobacterium sp.]|nr:hypothetical protein [Mycobacterium sp.]